MGRTWRRLAAGILPAIGLALLTAVPAAAKDTYPFFGPLEIRIVGADGDVRDFIALSTEDRRGANVFVEQVMAAMRGLAQPIEGAAGMLPHYQLGVSHLGMTYDTMPWAGRSEPSFIYYPGGEGTAYLLVRFHEGNASQERWLIPSPAVATMIDQHARGLAPIGTEPATTGGGTAIWGIAVGAALLASVTLMLVEDRRRWRLSGEGRSAGKGTDRRS